jgi:hypothetical protein
VTSPGPVTPHSDEVLVRAFEDAYWGGDVLEDHRISEDRVRAGIAAVRPLIEAGERTRLWEDINTNVAEAFFARAEEIRAGERTRIADAIEANTPDATFGIERDCYQHAARIARGETT